MPSTARHLIVNRSDLANARITENTLPDAPDPGTCLLRIDSFALTANNITYAVAPEGLGYWNFFPADKGMGRIPVWGFAEVIASAVPEVAEGTRVYGYLPMSTHLTIRPDRITSQSMMDGSDHRRQMSPIYNSYQFTAADPGWTPENEAAISLFRPLFTTSFLLADMLGRQEIDAKPLVVLSSASSKTAIGLAFLLSQQGIDVAGLTSSGNLGFVSALGCYAHVVSYDDIANLPQGPAAYVDMSGNAEVRSAVHGHFGDQLGLSSMVGITHWQGSGAPGADLPGATPEMFFAPAYAQQRIADWGLDGFQQRLGAAWQDFMPFVTPWLKVRQDFGPEAVLSAYQDMLAGRVDPSEGLILSMQEAQSCP